MAFRSPDFLDPHVQLHVDDDFVSWSASNLQALSLRICSHRQNKFHSCMSCQAHFIGEALLSCFYEYSINNIWICMPSKSHSLLHFPVHCQMGTDLGLRWLLLLRLYVQAA